MVDGELHLWCHVRRGDGTTSAGTVHDTKEVGAPGPGQDVPRRVHDQVLECRFDDVEEKVQIV